MKFLDIKFFFGIFIGSIGAVMRTVHTSIKKTQVWPTAGPMLSSVFAEGACGLGETRLYNFSSEFFIRIVLVFKCW